MDAPHETPRAISPSRADDNAEDQDLDDLLQELRILLQGIQVLAAFLIILPFSEGFGRIDQFEKWVYLVTFVASITGLVFVSAPATQHRLQRPLRGTVGNTSSVRPPG